MGIPHIDTDKGQMAAACVITKNTNKKSILEKNLIKKNILEYLIRELPKDELPHGGIHIFDSFPKTGCGKTDKIQLEKILRNEMH